MKDDHVAASGLDPVQNISKVIQIEVVADGDQNIPGSRADSLRAQFAFQFKVELP